MNAAARMAVLSLVPVGVLLGGGLGLLVGIPAALALASLGMFLSTVVLAASHIRHVQRVPDLEPVREPQVVGEEGDPVEWPGRRRPAPAHPDRGAGPRFAFEAEHLLPWYVAIEKALAAEYVRMGVITPGDAKEIAAALDAIVPAEIDAWRHRSLSDIALAIERFVADRLPHPIPAWHVDRSPQRPAGLRPAPGGQALAVRLRRRTGVADDGDPRLGVGLGRPAHAGLHPLPGGPDHHPGLLPGVAGRSPAAQVRPDAGAARRHRRLPARGRRDVRPGTGLGPRPAGRPARLRPAGAARPQRGRLTRVGGRGHRRAEPGRPAAQPAVHRPAAVGRQRARLLRPAGRTVGHLGGDAAEEEPPGAGADPRPDRPPGRLPPGRAARPAQHALHEPGRGLQGERGPPAGRVRDRLVGRAAADGGVRGADLAGRPDAAGLRGGSSSAGSAWPTG